MTEQIIVFVHGWSVTNTDTYGKLPERLQAEAAAGIALEVKHIFLGRYVSFHDEVRLGDIARAFQAAVRQELADLLEEGRRFACITHSTGGPVIRLWQHRYYQGRACPMSHLIMLAPANYGSALAQLGKSRVSRLKSWFQGVEPGQGVLDWLELGSKESWELNEAWIRQTPSEIGPQGFYPFVLTGQTIDRNFYDNLNTYTGELGSDGVVRVAAANVQGTYIRLEQEKPVPDSSQPSGFSAPTLDNDRPEAAPESALLIIAGKSHSGDTRGIMRSVQATPADIYSRETVAAIFDCLQVQSTDDYATVCRAFRKKTDQVQQQERVEIERSLLLSNTYFIHDRFSMVIFRVRDDEGHPVADFDLILTAGPKADPNHLPRGFFVDRQRNKLNPETITYYFNYDVMAGAPAVIAGGKEIRPALPGAGMLGFQLKARPDLGFVQYLPCEFKATADMLKAALRPNSTTLVDIILRRIVRRKVFELGGLEERDDSDFSRVKPEGDIVED